MVWLCQTTAEQTICSSHLLLLALLWCLSKLLHTSPQCPQIDGGAIEVESNPADFKFFDRTRGRVFIHPGSSLFSAGKFGSSWLVYTQVRDGDMCIVLQ